MGYRLLCSSARSVYHCRHYGYLCSHFKSATSGRHSHITGPIHNVATFVEAKELARHTDIRMTMKYTHVGIEDQAKAVAALPSLHIRCISGVSEGLPVSPVVI